MATPHGRNGSALGPCLGPCAGAATTVAILALCGGGIGLLHIVALLLVLSMGVDYGVFSTSYDPGGWVSQMVYPSGRVVAYTGDTAIAENMTLVALAEQFGGD